MNLAEIQKAASEAYAGAYLKGSHADGIAAVVAAVAQAVLAEPSDKEKCALGREARNTGYDTALECFVANRLASLLKPADERVPVLSRWISEGDMPLALAALDALPKERA